MGRGLLIFALLFLALPVLILLGVWATGAGLALALVGLFLVLIGFLVAIPMFDVDAV